MSYIDDVVKKIKDFDYKVSEVSYGEVLTVADNVVVAVGLNDIKVGEGVLIGDLSLGMIFSLEKDTVSIVVINDHGDIKKGDKIVSSGKMISTPVGMSMLGRVVDFMGNPIDGLGDINPEDYYNIERTAPSIIERKSIHQPFHTGIKIVDNLIPIGLGQRELIIGDRQTGKTSICIDSILNQSKINKTLPEKDRVYSVYVAIGQKKSNIAKIIRKLKEESALSDCVIVVSSASDLASRQYIAPYIGCSIAEYFRDNGMNSVVIYDDLSKHAVAYREISLLLRRPPGREAFSGDIFYCHSRLLERAAKMSDEKGGGSLTALPIIETQGGDISAYIPTNVISITDGQIFLDKELFNSGFRPAINIGLSVSRVGSSAQFSATKKVASRLKLDLAQFRELESFSQFGSDIDKETQLILEKGKKIQELLKQDVNSTILFEEQIPIFYAILKNYIEKIPFDKIRIFETNLISSLKLHNMDLVEKIKQKKSLDDDMLKSLDNLIHNEINLLLND